MNKYGFMYNSLPFFFQFHLAVEDRHRITIPTLSNHQLHLRRPALLILVYTRFALVQLIFVESDMISQPWFWLPNKLVPP